MAREHPALAPQIRGAARMDAITSHGTDAAMAIITIASFGAGAGVFASSDMEMTASLAEMQWGAPVRAVGNEITYSGFPLAPVPSEIEITRTTTQRVLTRAAEVGPTDLGHHFPTLLDPMIYTGPRYLRFGTPFQPPATVYTSEGFLSRGARTAAGRFEIGTVPARIDPIGQEAIIHRAFSQKPITLP
jgi:hypothetical protein